MKALLAVLTVANFVLLLSLGTQMRPAEASAQAGVLRGSALEVKDDRLEATMIRGAPVATK